MRIARAFLVAVVLGLGCRRADPSPSADAGSAAALAHLDVQVSGCTIVLRGGVCEVVPGAEVRVWLPGVEDDGVRVVAGASELPVAVTRWPDGRAVRVTPPAGATALDVHARVADGEATGRVMLAPAEPVSPVLERARKLRREGHVEEAAAALADDAGAPPSAAALSARARIEFQLGRVSDAAVDFRAAMTRHEAEGRVSEAADDAAAFVYMLTQRDQMAEARAVLDQERGLVADFPDGQMELVDDEGLLAWATGDLRTAIRSAREASDRAARLGADRRRRAYLLTLGLRLQQLGRYAESITLFRELVDDPGPSPCERADLLTDLAWGALLQVDDDPAAGAPGLDAREPIGRAMAILRGECPDPNALANNLENLALADLQHGALADARAALDEARKAERDPPMVVAIFWHHLAGRIALAQGSATQALASFKTEANLAAAFGSSADALAAAEGRAAALTALGRKNDALAALDAADALVDVLSASVPLGEGMATFLAATDRAAVRRVDLLSQLGRNAEALQAARSWRARLLERLRLALVVEHLAPAEHARWQDAVGRYRALREGIEQDTAHDWALPADRLAAARARREATSAQARVIIEDALSALPRTRAAPDAEPAALAPGDLEMLYLRAPSGWLGFARTDTGLSVARLPSFDPSAAPAALADAVLVPFDAAIAGASRLRFLPYRQTRGIDFHALPWRGKPLLDHARVEYGLGLDVSGAMISGGSHALVVADPTSDLPSARKEADAVSAILKRDDRWHVDDLRGAAADGDALRSGLGSADLLHYAGHASYGGEDGMESALALAHGNRLTPADVLTLPRVPPRVMLFGCDTGRESATGALDALGLSTAFLVAGARSVVATSRVVDDALARDVAAEFYARFVASPDRDVAGALRDAVISVRDRTPGADWSAFRALVP